MGYLIIGFADPTTNIDAKAQGRIIQSVERREEDAEGIERAVFYEYLPASDHEPALFLRRYRTPDIWGTWLAPVVVEATAVPCDLVWRVWDD